MFIFEGGDLSKRPSSDWLCVEITKISKNAGELLSTAGLGTRREDVTDHYESNPNCFTDKRLAKHGDLEEMRAPEDANKIIIRLLHVQKLKNALTVLI